jgi:aquaporin related protein
MNAKSYFANISADCQAAAFEFVGTTFFLLLGLGGIQATAMAAATSGINPSPIERIMFISTCMGLSLLVAAWLFFRVTGGLFNPNVSLALVLLGIIRPVRFVLFCIAQLVGAITASALIEALTPGQLSVNTVLHPSLSPACGVFIEMFITSALVLAVLMLAAEKHLTTPFAPIGIGLTLFSCHLWAVFYTGAAMNTARAFGPAVILGFPDRNHWVYWVGPCLGSFLGAGFYAIIKYFNYLKLCPDQDAIDPQKSAQINPNPFTIAIR